MGNALNKHESKYFNTARLMNEALLLLLEKHDYQFVTVKDICTKAGVNRSTFYLHYETIDDLLAETLAYTTAKFDEKFAQSGETIDPMSDLVLITPKYILPYLEYLKEHKKLYMAAMSQQKVLGVDKYSKCAFEQTIYPILQKMNVPKAEEKYVAAFYVSGMHSLVFEWVKGGCQEDVDYICNLMMKMIPEAKTDVT